MADLSWTDLRWTVTANGRPKEIIRGVDGFVRKSHFLAILGGSGSGKTSLLELLAGATPPSAGEVLFDGALWGPETLKNRTGYVMQDDALLGALTVRETFQFTADLRCAAAAGVQAAVDQLGLRGCADTRVAALSGGERRRVSIGCQLLADPLVLFCDEPTSGLDSFSALNIVRLLQELPRTVVATIHTPGSALFRLFDQITILSEGRTVYNGGATSLVAFFEGQGFSCPTESNPLDFAIDLCTIDFTSDRGEGDSRTRIDALAAASLELLPPEHRRASSGGRRVDDERARRPGCAFTTLVLTRRSWLCVARDGPAAFMRLTQLALFAVLVLLFMPKLTDDQTGIQNRTGLLYESVSPTVIIGLLNAVTLFPPVRAVYYRDRADGLYTAGPFLAAHTIVETPFYVFAGVLFSALLYPAVGLNPVFSHFWIYTLVMVVLHAYGETLGLIFLFAIFDVTTATNVATLSVSFTTLAASGFLRSVALMPRFYQVIAWACVQKPASEVLVVNEYTNCWGDDCPLALTCSEGEVCTYTDGNQYLAAYYPDAVGRFWPNVWATIAWAVGLRLILWALMQYKTRVFRS